MINGADKRVSSAFLATLREEPSSSAILASFTRKERPNATNVVKVDGLSDAIARAEDAMRERVRSSSRPDIFESLIATDDASGPALYQPYTPTPIPPRPSSIPPPLPAYAIPPPPALPTIEAVPRQVCAPIIVLDRQAFYHPAVPALPPPLPQSRKSALAWFAVAFVTPLLAVALFAVAITLLQAKKAPSVSATIAPQEPAIVAPSVVTPAAPVATEPPMLVVEVKTLKSAPSSPRKQRR